MNSKKQKQSLVLNETEYSLDFQKKVVIIQQLNFTSEHDLELSINPSKR